MEEIRGKKDKKRLFYKRKDLGLRGHNRVDLGKGKNMKILDRLNSITQKDGFGCRSVNDSQKELGHLRYIPEGDNFSRSTKGRAESSFRSRSHLNWNRRFNTPLAPPL